MLPRLYPIVDVDLCRGRGLDALAVLDAFLTGGARFVQVRDKSASTGAAVALADAAVARAHRAGARLIINDRVDVARLCGADGVHLGQDDLSVEDARLIVGAAAIVGMSTHTEDQIDAASRTSATYVATGPIYGTSTKETGYSARGLDLVRHAVRVLAGRPVVAIGGITLERAPEAIAAGAASVAVISDLLHGDPAERVRTYFSALTPRNV